MGEASAVPAAGRAAAVLLWIGAGLARGSLRPDRQRLPPPGRHRSGSGPWRSGRRRSVVSAKASRLANASTKPVPRTGSTLGRGRPRRAERGSLLFGDLVGTLLGHAEDVGHLGEADDATLHTSLTISEARDLRVRVPSKAELQRMEHSRVRDRHRRVVGRGVHGQMHVDGQQEPRIDLAEPRLVLGPRILRPQYCCSPQHHGGRSFDQAGFAGPPRSQVVSVRRGSACAITRPDATDRRPRSRTPGRWSRPHRRSPDRLIPLRSGLAELRTVSAGWTLLGTRQWAVLRTGS
jgi:hypothetical protein